MKMLFDLNFIIFRLQDAKMLLGIAASSRVDVAVMEFGGNVSWLLNAKRRVGFTVDHNH